MNLDKVVEAINQHDSFVILGHKNGDSDSYGGGFALAQILNKMNKSSAVMLEKDFPDNLSFLFNYFTGDMIYQTDTKYDALIILDVSDMSRVCSKETAEDFIKQSKKVIHLDHHTLGDLANIASVSFVDQDACATSEIIYNLAAKLEIEINKNIATCLLTGIVGDTGSFENQNSTASSFNVAASLMNKGARLRVIVSNAFENKEIADLKLWGLALERLYYNPVYKTAITYITKADLDKLSLDYEVISGVVNYLNSIKSAKMVVLITEDSIGTVKVSLRTRDNNMDVASLARQLGGGGHVKASGISMPGKINILKNGFITIGQP